MRFADTSWWAAWALPDDNQHRRALALLAELRPNEVVLTTNLIAGETWTLLRNRASHRTAIGFLDRVQTLSVGGRLVVHQVQAEQEDAAWTWLRRHDERPYSFVDAASFTVMRDRRLREALTFDADFEAAGFVALGRQ